jgi:hypothetical protein
MTLNQRSTVTLVYRRKAHLQMIKSEASSKRPHFNHPHSHGSCTGSHIEHE